MTRYNNFEQVFNIFDELFGEVFSDPDIAKKLEQSNMVIKYNLSEPDGVVWVDTKTKQVIKNDYDKDFTVELTVTADLLHDFLMKKLNINTALATKKIKTKGAILQFLKFVPFMNKAIKIYPEVAKKHGILLEA